MEQRVVGVDQTLAEFESDRLIIFIYRGFQAENRSTFEATHKLWEVRLASSLALHQ